MKNLLKKITGRRVVSILVCVAILVGCVWWFGLRQSGTVSADASYITSEMKRVTALDKISGSGYLKSYDSAEIRAAVTSQVSEVFVKNGDMVVKDQPLFRLNNATLLSNLQQAQSDLATAQNNYDKLGLQNGSLSGELRDAQLKVEQKQNALDTQNTNLQNLQIVAPADGRITEVNVEVGDDLSAYTALFDYYRNDKEKASDYQLKLQQVLANLEAKEKEYEKLTVTANLTGQVSDISVKPGESVVTGDHLLNLSEPDRLSTASNSSTVLKIQQAELNLSDREKELGYLEVTATATGMLSDLSLKPGDTVSTVTNLATVNDNRQLIARVNVPQSFINGVALGNKAEVMITNSARTYKGVVSDVSPSGNLDSSSYVISYPVEITIDNDGTLLAGMSAVVDISSSDVTFKSVSSLRGTLANDVTKAVNPKVSGEIVELRAKNGDWVMEGQIIAVLKNESVELNYAQAQEDLKKLKQDEFYSPGIATVESVRVANGDWVEKGQVLMTLRSNAVESAYFQAKSDYEKLLNNETGNTDIRNKVAGTVETIYVKAGDTVRTGQLLAELSSSDLLYQEQRAEADLEQTKAELNSLLKNSSAGELQQAWSKLEQAKLNLENRQKSVDDLLVKALISGSYTEKLGVTVGSEVEAMNLLGIIYNYDAFKLVIDVDELEIPKLGIGNAVSISVDAFPGKVYAGEIVEIAREGNTSSGGSGSTFPVTLEFTTADALRAGMTATAEITLQKSENTFTVVKSAVSTLADGSYAVTLLVDGELKTVPVEIGVVMSSMVELKSGVTEGDLVVTGSVNLASGDLTTMGGATIGTGGGGFGGGFGGR